MSKNKTIAVGLLAMVMVSARAATYVNQEVHQNPDGSSYTNWVECVINQEVIWHAKDGPFIVDNYDLGITIQTNGSLTVEAGTELIFPSSRDWSGLQVFGRLSAVGTSASPIVFRRDPAETNGAWSGIRFYTNSTGTLAYVEIENAGHLTSGWQSWHPNAAIYIQDSSPDINHASIRASQGSGIRITGRSSPVIASNQIDDCSGYAVQWEALLGTPTFTENSGTGDNLSAILIANGRVDQSWTMTVNELPYVLAGYDGAFAVGTNATVTINPGVVIKTLSCRDDGSITVFGKLLCGSPSGAPVVLTSVKDDAANGDTDNSTNAPAPGDWSGIRFYAGSDGTLENTELRYAGHITSGWQSWHPAAGIYIVDSSPTIRSTDIISAQGYGVRIEGKSMAQVSGNQISYCGDYAFYWKAFAGNPRIENNTGGGNGHDGIFVPSGTILTNGTLRANEPFPYVLASYDGNLVVESNVCLTIQPGVIVKSGDCRDGGAIVVNGQLIVAGEPGRPIIFTSLEDDTGGDTDRTTNAPYVGSWSGIRVGGGPCHLSHAYIRYAGHVTYGWQAWHPAAVFYCTGGNTELEDVLIQDFPANGLRLAGGNATVTGSLFQRGSTAVWIENGGENSVVNHSAFVNIAGSGVANGNANHEFDACNNWWGDASGPSTVGPGNGCNVSEHVLYGPLSDATKLTAFVGLPTSFKLPESFPPPYELLWGTLPPGMTLEPITGIVGIPTKPLVSGFWVQAGAKPYFVELDIEPFVVSGNQENLTLHPMLSWKPIEGATYRVQVATDVTFSQLVYDASGLSTTFLEPPGLQPGTRYFWRVAPSVPGAWSPAASFTTWQGGPNTGYALGFDGNSQMLALSSVPDFSQMPQWTICAWVKPNAQSQSWPTIYAYGYWGASLGVTKDGRIESWINNSEQLDSAGTVPSNRWTAVSLVYDGTNRIFYINGSEAGRGNAPAVDRATSGSIGGIVGRGTGSFSGEIDEVSVWNTALTPAQLCQKMSKPLGTGEPGLVSCYHFDESSGDSALDSAVREMSAQLLNSPTWEIAGWPSVSACAPEAGKLQVEWSAGVGHVLEWSSDLGQPDSWSELGVTNNPATIDTDSGARWFRVRAP